MWLHYNYESQIPLRIFLLLFLLNFACPHYLWLAWSICKAALWYLLKTDKNELKKKTCYAPAFDFEDLASSKCKWVYKFGISIIQNFNCFIHL